MALCNIHNKYKNKYRGSALAYTLVIMTIVMIILTSMIGYIVSQLKFSFNRVEREEAFQIAEAGIYYYRWYLAHETAGKTAQQVSDFWQNGDAKGVSSPLEEDFEGRGTYRVEVTPPSPGSTIVIVKSTGWTNKLPGTKRTVQVRFRRPSWSEYMFLINDFIAFGNQSEVYGEVYSNTGVRFEGIAHNVVSCLVPSFDDPDYGSHELDFGVYTPTDPHAPSYPWPDGTVPDKPDVFLAGRKFPVPEISFNSVTTDLGAMKTAAKKPNDTTVNDCTSTGCYFDSTGGGRRIILNGNTFGICTVDSYQQTTFAINKYKKINGSGTCNNCGGDCIENKNIPDNGIIFVENNAWVEGTVNNKRVTIAAANLLGGEAANIFIGLGNLRYNSYDCNNNIGLVAQKDVAIVKACLNDLTIDAALLAQTGRVGIGDYGVQLGTLTINGAIASYLHPYFIHGVSGFGDLVFNYDNNLIYCSPAYFPTGTEYSIDLWEEL